MPLPRSTVGARQGKHEKFELVALTTVRTLMQNEQHFRRQPTRLPMSHWVALGGAMCV